MMDLEELLAQTAVLHKHLCPRQVLGVRMGLFSGELLGLELPQSRKRLLTIMETDGCGADGVAVATNCWVGRRTMRIEDYGKMAATFVDTRTETAVRVYPHPLCRETALKYAPEAKNKWQGYLLGYQRMPTEELLAYQLVQLRRPVAELISKPGLRTLCDRCGEEIINQREVKQRDLTLCKGCAGEAYYAICDQIAFLQSSDG
ncbi:Formylmethanofuran dehydrogenase subunit E [hydrothermal vent metagenome]|uniref:Formylmethanofuran dehydrogenase subunit E n=1 Tax=hydrothermal vent metagenome TaxID=652676 RepID=A0A3B0V6D0_9ZZZZ